MPAIQGTRTPALPSYSPAFEPVPHDKPQTQTVWGGTVSATSDLTASITAGSVWFKIAKLSVFDAALVWIETSAAGELPAGHGPARPTLEQVWRFTPVGASNGSNPLAVQAGQYVTLDVAVDVPQDPQAPAGAAGPSLPPGPFTGTASIEGGGFSETVDLSGTFLAVALGSPIGQKWLALGGQAKLGATLDLPHGAPDGIGTLQSFASGVLYQVPAASAAPRLPQVWFVAQDIYAKWASLGSATDATGQPVWTALGYPVGDTFPTAEGGQAVQFQRGAIVRRTGGQVWLAYGAIYAHYQSFGNLADPGHQPWIGLPTSDEGTAEFTAGWRVSHFDGGDIYWSNDTGAWEMHGAILQHWLAVVASASLGLPTTDETIGPDGKGHFNLFGRNGAIWWTATTGAQALTGPILDRWNTLGGGNSYLGYPTSDIGPCPAAVLELVAAGATSGDLCSFEFGRLVGTPDGRLFELPATVSVSASGTAGADTGHLAYSGTMTLKSNGDFEVAFHVEDDATFGYGYQIAAAARTSSGIWLGAVRSGSVAGSSDTGGSKTEQPTVSGNHPWIAHYWPQVQQGLTLKVTLDYAVNGVAGFLIAQVEALAGDLVGGVIAGPVAGAMLLLGEEVSQLGLGVNGTIGVVAGVAAVVTPGCVLLAVAAGVVAGAVAASDIQTRQLTQAEYDFATNVFQGTLPPMGQLRLTNLSGLNGRCFTTPGIDGNIYLHLGQAYDAPSTFTIGLYPNGYPRKGEVFIHELTHAWQIHHSSFLAGFVCDAVVTQLKYMTGTNVYEYGPPTSPWSGQGGLGIEAQAAVVDEWFGGVPDAALGPGGISYTPNRTSSTDGEDPSSPDFAGGASDPYFHYIRDNIRAGKT